MKVTCEVHVDPYYFVQGTERQHLLDFIQAVDAFVAEAEFTEELIKMLAYSLKADKEDVSLPFIDWEKM